jgi:hypothetical protein
MTAKQIQPVLKHMGLSVRNVFIQREIWIHYQIFHLSVPLLSFPSIVLLQTSIEGSLLLLLSHPEYPLSKLDKKIPPAACTPAVS